MSNLRAVVEAIKRSCNVMVCSHVEPDGDSIGSQLALASLLRDLGKKVAIVNQDPVPERYRFLDSQGLIRDRLPTGFWPDTAAMLDCSSMDRLGQVRDLIAPTMVIITIDHHQAFTKPDDPACLEPLASSTGELIFHLLKDMEMPIGRERATPLYAAILTDTGGFRFPNTSATCLAAAAQLVTEGADPHSIASQIYERRSQASLKLLSCALDKIEILEEGQICLVCIEQEDLKACQARPDEMDGIVDQLVTLEGCQIGILMREASGETVKVNLRSRGSIKANKIAEALGGGGHPSAAGYRTRGPLSLARDQFFREVKKWL